MADRGGPGYGEPGHGDPEYGGPGQGAQDGPAYGGVQGARYGEPGGGPAQPGLGQNGGGPAQHNGHGQPGQGNGFSGHGNGFAGQGNGFPGQNGGRPVQNGGRPGHYDYTEPFDYGSPQEPPAPNGQPHVRAPRPGGPMGPVRSASLPSDAVPPGPGQPPPGHPQPGPPQAPAEETMRLGTAGESGTAPPPARGPGEGRAARRKAAKRIKRRRRLSATKEIPILIGVALLIALVLKTFLVQAFVIPSGSMEQTIRIGDRVLVDKLTPWFGSKPHRGDVVVFKDPGGWLEGEQKPKQDPPAGLKQGKQLLSFIGLLPSDDEQDLIKRVVGVGGDRVRCCDSAGKVTVNGTPLKEPYVHPGNAPSQMKFDVTVPIGRVFVMGDHRANSADSRFHLREGHRGTVPEQDVVGRAVVIAWPFGHWRRLEEPATYASVTDAPGAATAAGGGNGDNRVTSVPSPAVLPLVMGVVGLSRLRDGSRGKLRSERGGLGGRHTVRFRRRRTGRPPS
ncbi:signal peptidase I [Actinacidiphila sp. SB3-2]